MKFCLTAAFIISLSLGSFANNDLTLAVQPLNTDKHRLIAGLLKLSLSKEDFNVKFRELTEEVSDARLMEKVRLEQADVMWAGMSEVFEKELLPIRIPIFKGILGHRIFVIPEGTQEKFNQVTNLDDLKKLQAGQGHFWGDTKILEAAGLPTIRIVRNDSMWAMINARRFDYFPLAIHEPWTEISTREKLNLSVEENLLLIYPFAMYFYVNLDNQQLYEHIYKGMNKAIGDGSYDKYLFNSDIFKSGLEAANIAKRTIIRIDNPFMHPETPTHIPQYWLDIKNFSIN